MLPVSPPIDTLESGLALYGELRDLLAGEREALVHRKLSELDAANRRREVLLGEIGSWESEARELAETAGGDAPRLGMAIAALPGADRERGEVLLRAIIETATEARRLAEVNHIIAERNRDVVEQTVSILTGTGSGKIYNARGAVSRGPADALLQRKE